ncbi:toll-like receptor 4 [Sardina pilchardus]|uniref:toll-like receptor 4 n=1 Tax=Sardina pilchardus TaxID=27697 RepID=UPI002E121A3D
MIVVGGKMLTLPGHQLSHQHSLRRLVINDNSHLSVFQTLVDLPSLEYLDLSRNVLTIYCCDLEFVDTPNLRYLNLSVNSAVTIRVFGLVNHPTLEILDVHNTKVIVEKDFSDVMEHLRYLKYLDLSNSQMTFKNKLFHGLRSLKELKMASNSFAKGIFGELFLNLTTLEVLDISNCAIENIPLTSFQNLHKLEHLTLNNNHIAAISPNVLKNLPADLSVLDLSFNPIECSCSQTEFISWIINHQSVLKDPQLMSCKSSSKNSRVINFDLTYCANTNRGVITVSIFAAVIVFLFSALLYKYQFYIHYCFILLRGNKMSRQEECSYDAFVIYSSKDETWVLEELAENLEKGLPPIQLCLHERDFQAGKSITSNIVDEGITGSRKAIVVVSQHFLDSTLCQFEFELAQSWLVLRRNASIIIIILEDVEDKKIRRLFGLHKYLKKNTYLKWKGNVLSNVRFWARLRKAIIAQN